MLRAQGSVLLDSNFPGAQNLRRMCRTGERSQGQRSAVDTLALRWLRPPLFTYLFISQLQSFYIHFLLTINCWTCSLPLRVVCFPGETLMKETKFSSASGYQIASGSSWMKILTLLLFDSTCHVLRKLAHSVCMLSLSHSLGFLYSRRWQIPLFLEYVVYTRLALIISFSLPSREGRREERKPNGERERGCLFLFGFLSTCSPVGHQQEELITFFSLFFSPVWFVCCDYPFPL